MAGRTVSIELTDDQAEQLDQLAGQTNISLPMLLAEIVAAGIAQRAAKERRRDAEAAGGDLDDDIPL